MWAYCQDFFSRFSDLEAFRSEVYIKLNGPSGNVKISAPIQMVYAWGEGRASLKSLFFHAGMLSYCCDNSWLFSQSDYFHVICQYWHTLKLRHLGVLDSVWRLSKPPHTASCSSACLVLVGLCPICHCTKGACHSLTIKLIFNSWLKWGNIGLQPHKVAKSRTNVCNLYFHFSYFILKDETPA